MTSAERLRKDPDTEAREVNRQVAVLKAKETELRQLDKVVLDLTEDEAIEAEVEGATDYHDKILYAIADAQFFLSQREQSTHLSEPSRSRPNGDRVAATQSNIASAEAPQGPVSTPRYRSVALPTLQVPTYAGDLRQWQEFWDHYSATIHNNIELPPIEKFKYLLTYLRGAAKRAIEGIRLADNNYDIAVKTLKERFGRQELLVNEHIDQLLALSPVRSSKEVEKLRMLQDAVRFRVSALEGLGVPPDQYTVVLNRVLMRCLPEDLAILYRQKKKEESTQDGDASVEHTTPEARTHKATDILSFLKIQVEVREEGKQAAPSSHPCHSTMVHDDMNSPTRSAHAIPSAPALVATESQQQRTLSCVLCNSRAHSLAECTVDMSVEEKKARFRNSRCCYRCGTRNHVAQFCRVSRNLMCNKCRRRHLTVLCELSRAVAMTASPRTTEQLITSGTTPPTVTTASTGEKGAKSVLLQTGRVWAESGPRRLLVRVMLDSGSQRSFIRTDVSKRLRCRALGIDELSLVTVGNAKLRHQLRCKRVSVTLRGRFNDSTVTLEALEVPEVCSATSPLLDTEALELLCARKHDAADLFDPETWHPDDISILIGSDAYWKVATGSIDRLNEELTAVETSFGWTVQGASSPHEATTTCALLMSAGVECDESAMWRLDTIGIENQIPKKTQELDMFVPCLSRQARCYQEHFMIQEPRIPADSLPTRNDDSSHLLVGEANSPAVLPVVSSSLDAQPGRQDFVPLSFVELEKVVTKQVDHLGKEEKALLLPPEVKCSALQAAPKQNSAIHAPEHLNELNLWEQRNSHVLRLAPDMLNPSEGDASISTSVSKFVMTHSPDHGSPARTKPRHDSGKEDEALPKRGPNRLAEDGTPPPSAAS
ncbi:uncharacterized protein LOC119397560 [Rhipicephalus sanguineus]|uniref:uncharacterized protein LOC119397560 n=1 Tax=Rhipicephalus sanguineus TaxID=34632 RepID=UPI0018933F12|nr:uncharacterized protein LOC119397560 [Rhipicephalus sanguineus]